MGLSNIAVIPCKQQHAQWTFYHSQSDVTQTQIWESFQSYPTHFPQNKQPHLCFDTVTQSQRQTNHKSLLSTSQSLSAHSKPAKD